MAIRAKVKHTVILSRPHADPKVKKNVRVKVKAGSTFDFTEKEFKELHAANPGLLTRKGHPVDNEPALKAGAPVVSETGDGVVVKPGKTAPQGPTVAEGDGTGDDGTGDDDDTGDTGDTGDAGDPPDDDDDL